MTIQPNKIEILLVKDTAEDVMTEKALACVKVLSKLHVVTDGVEALQFLRKQGRFADVLSPDLIFLDLHLPLSNGIEALAEVKTDNTFRQIPVVVLSNSKREEDVLKAYDSGANCYIHIPADFDRLCGLIENVSNFWSTIATLPPR